MITFKAAVNSSLEKTKTRELLYSHGFDELYHNTSWYKFPKMSIKAITNKSVHFSGVVVTFFKKSEHSTQTPLMTLEL